MGNRDILEKRLEENADVFADIMNNIVFEGNHVLDTESLVNLSAVSYSRKQNGNWWQGYRDIIMADRRNQQYHLICGIENQEDYDNTMPVRTMGYDYAAYEKQIKEIRDKNRSEGLEAYTKGILDGQKLIPVVTAVLSFGNSWKGPRSLHELLSFPEEYRELLTKLVPDYPLNLIEIENLSEEVIGRMTSDFRIVAEYYASRKDEEKKKIFRTNTEYKIQHPEQLLEFMATVTGDKRYLGIVEKIATRKEEELTMCIILDEIEKQGIEQGIEQGMKIGRQLNCTL